MENLERIGYGSWLQAHMHASKMAGHEIARVVSVHKGSYMVSKGDGDVFAELTGKLAYSSNSAADLPTTGDWVYVDFYDGDTHAIIHDVFPRKTLIQRKSSGKSIDFQLVAANIDTAFIVQSVDYNFNLRRLERYLVMVNESNITPVILLSKCDLISQEQINKIVESVVEITSQTTILPFSNQSGVNIDAIKNLLLYGHTYCLLGSSGVGKTTLLNSILGSELFKTRTVGKIDSKGRHTTTSRELVSLDNGAMLIDTPGMRELGNISVEVGIDETFSDIIGLSMSCKFSNCKHINEKGCAILSAINDAALSEKRYQNYIKMKNESSFNEMSYFEKRQKDKNFGKMVKSVMINKPKKQ
ncbi:MAG: ribosome small subunit-dependent GTPase A [Gammaproteobacteria bacterium]|nr:ribosome small subunit-dependent GTPase A [Gammaproteobacteria bacterium]